MTASIETQGFSAFWAAWPSNTVTYTRKGCKAECLKRWKARHHETQADQIVKHVEWMKTTADWLKDGGAFIPAPLVYLNQQRWDGAEIPVLRPRPQADVTSEELRRMSAPRTPPSAEALAKARSLGSRKYPA